MMIQSTMNEFNAQSTNQSLWVCVGVGGCVYNARITPVVLRRRRGLASRNHTQSHNRRNHQKRHFCVEHPANGGAVVDDV